MESIPFIRIQAPTNRTVVNELQETLDPGEAEALALALEMGVDAVLIDESAGRAMAVKRGLQPLGVPGVLLRAKERALIGSMRPLLDRLQSELGFFIAPSLRDEILRVAKEKEEDPK